MKVVLYGASGHGKVVYSILEASDHEIVGFIDDDPSIKRFMDLPVFPSTYLDNNKDLQGIISIGNNELRRKLSELSFQNFITAKHPSAQIHPSVSIGLGTVVAHHAILQIDSTVGHHCIVNSGAIVEHDCTIADFVHIAPNVTLCGGVSIGEGTLVGAGSVILPMVHVGAGVTIGAGSVVIRDIPDGATVVGNPARVIWL